MYIPSQYVLIQQEISQFSLNLVSLSCVNVLNVFLTTGVLTGRREFTEIGKANFSAYGNHFHERSPLANNSAKPGQAKKLVIKNFKGKS